ncbi:MAG: hypothetical protein ACLPJJ_11230 [Acidocella sp.]|uniref:hypothetical protein n=1 Tax=Acidocella sp. TaxID=50710 RepID=UPI003FBCFE3B
MYIHAGLHKTGTTALQNFLASQADALKTHAVLYPNAGRPPDYSGHHNLAWQLIRDRRYRAAFGSVQDLDEELRTHDGDAIISSEDFSSLLGSDAWLATLSALPNLGRYRLVPILYIREQGAFFKSLFMELTQHGLTEEPARLADIICRTGSFYLCEWTFHFDYLRIATLLRRATHGAAIFRSYHRLAGGSTITDFIQQTVPGLSLPNAGTDNKTNTQRDLLEALVEFHQTRLGLPLNEAQQDLLRARATRLHDDEPKLSPALAKRFTTTFRHTNHQLRQMLGEDFAFPPPLTAPEDALEQLFSFELQCELTRL